MASDVHCVTSPLVAAVRRIFMGFRAPTSSTASNVHEILGEESPSNIGVTGLRGVEVSMRKVPSLD